jgi:hypothetical protein
MSSRENFNIVPVFHVSSDLKCDPMSIRGCNLRDYLNDW